MGETKVVGLAQLEAQLSELPSKLAKRIVRSALQNAGAILQQEMGVRAPRRAEGGGYLTTHIGVSVSLSGENAGTAKVAPTQGAYYGLMQELGFTTVSGTHVPPQPFMRPAFEAKQDECLKAIIEEIHTGLAEVAK